jgi:glycolate oxidase iron-sulfur subunit
MKTSITNNYLESSAGQEANRILRNCVHCGFCNATCPTYQLLGDELDGPRGRIYLIKNILEGETPTTKTQLHLDRCLTCRNCETTCPSGVEYGKLIDIGRKLVTDKVNRSIGQKLFRFSLRKFLLSSNLFSLSLRIGQLFQPLLPKSLAQNIPEHVSETLSWPTNEHPRKILLVEGCVQSALQPNIDKAAAIVLDRMTIQSLRVNAAGCCGAVSHHLNAEKEAHSYIKRNIDAWWPLIKTGSVEAICMTASGCGVMIKDYAHILKDVPDYADKAEKVSTLYKDPSEIITSEHLKIKQPGARIAFHPPCTLQHGLRLNGKIESMLTALGHELVDFDDKHLCCGSAGTYSITQKELSVQLRNNKLAAITTNDPEIIVTANIGCQTHLQGGTDTPVKHWLELLI